MKKIEYKTVRFSDDELFKRAKMRAVREEISLLELVEKIMREYLKSPLDKPL